MSRRTFLRQMAMGTLSLGIAVFAMSPAVAVGQEEITRKVKIRVQPLYPELAKKMSISGTVKLQVVVAPNGTVKSTKVLGGHPLLANAASDAMKKWRFEAGPQETTGLVEFKFAAIAQ